MSKTALRKQQLIEKYKDEKVFVVPFSRTEEILDGFHPITEKAYAKLVDVVIPKCKFILRSDGE